jgi:hypothetical protein
LYIQLFIVMAAMLKRTYGLRNLITKLLTKGIVGLLYLYLCNRALVQPIIFRVRGFYSVQYDIKPVFLFPLPLLLAAAHHLPVPGCRLPAAMDGSSTTSPLSSPLSLSLSLSHPWNPPPGWQPPACVLPQGSPPQCTTALLPAGRDGRGTAPLTCAPPPPLKVRTVRNSGGSTEDPSSSVRHATVAKQGKQELPS